jgi:hypothetical protein
MAGLCLRGEKRKETLELNEGVSFSMSPCRIWGLSLISLRAFLQSALYLPVTGRLPIVAVDKSSLCFFAALQRWFLLGLR